MDAFMQAAVEEARQGLAEGGIPIGAVLVHKGIILGRGHNRRGKKGSAISMARWMPWTVYQRNCECWKEWNRATLPGLPNGLIPGCAGPLAWMSKKTNGRM